MTENNSVPEQFKITWVQDNTLAARTLAKDLRIQVAFSVESDLPRDQTFVVDGVDWKVTAHRRDELIRGEGERNQEPVYFLAALHDRRIIGLVYRLDLGDDTDPGAWEAEIDDTGCEPGDSDC